MSAPIITTENPALAGYAAGTPNPTPTNATTGMIHQTQLPAAQAFTTDAGRLLQADEDGNVVAVSQVEVYSVDITETAGEVGTGDGIAYLAVIPIPAGYTVVGVDIINFAYWTPGTTALIQVGDGLDQPSYYSPPAIPSPPPATANATGNYIGGSSGVSLKASTITASSTGTIGLKASGNAQTNALGAYYATGGAIYVQINAIGTQSGTVGHTRVQVNMYRKSQTPLTVANAGVIHVAAA